jgi:hypothetical protein
MVTVAESEGVGEGVVERQVAPVVVPHGHGAVGTLIGRRGVDLHEAVHFPAVPAQVLGAPVVGEVVGAFVAARRAEVEGQQHVRRRQGRSARVVLREDAQRVLRVVVEAAALGVRAEVMVIGPVLHHEEHDVLDGPEVGPGRSGRRGRLDEAGSLRSTGERRRSRTSHGESGTGHAQRSQQLATAQARTIER